jgi:hypothetical protein
LNRPHVTKQTWKPIRSGRSGSSSASRRWKPSHASIASSLRALGTLQTELATEFQQLDTLEASLEQIEKQLAQLQKQFHAACAKLSAARVAAAGKLSRRISELMQTLGMPGGVFEIAVRALAADTANAHGADEVEFLVSANPGQPPRPLAKVASGGELSRISLAIQVAAATVRRLAVPGVRRSGRRRRRRCRGNRRSSATHARRPRAGTVRDASSSKSRARLTRTCA